MFKQITQVVFCLALILGSLSLAGANTLSGYALSQKGPNINAKMPGALVEFKDAATNKAVEVKMKAGVEIKGRRDAFYAMSTGDIGRWQANVKKGRYIVTITGISGGKPDVYELNLSTWVPCTTTTGNLNVKDCQDPANGTDYTQAIIDGVAALHAIGGGVLYFPQGYFNVGTILDNPATTKVNESTAALLPIVLESGITLQGTNGGISGTDWGSCRITLINPTDPTAVHNKTVFKIGENKRHISIRDVAVLAYNYTAPTSGIPGSTGLLAEGDYPNSTFDILFSNMSFWGFDVGVDVKGCTAAHAFGLGCVQNPNVDPVVWISPWQFDQVKADHVSFGNKIGVRMDSENTDWNFSSCWFHMPPDTTASNLTPVSSGIHIKRGGFIQVNNTFGGSANPAQPGGNFIWAGSLGTLMITNSQTEAIKNSLVWGRDPLSGENYDLGSTSSRIMVIGSEFGAPVKLRYRVTYVSEGNHYGPNTIVADTDLVRIWSTGDKFCDDGYVPTAACTPTISGGTVVFMSGTPAEAYIPEIPAQFGVKSVFKSLVQLGSATYSVLTSTYASADNGSLLYCSDCGVNTTTGACTSGGSGAVAKRLGGAWKCN